MSLVLGVDSSTQSTKAELRRTETGEVVARGRCAHPPTSPPVSEQDPSAWWAALVEACSQLGERRREVVAVSVAGQQHGLVVLDERDRVLRPAKLWNDTTSAPHAAAMVASAGAVAWAAACGSVPVASFTITKLAWLVEHEPELAARTARLMLPHDYLTFRLTGRHTTDVGDASGTGWFDPERREISPETFDWAGVDRAWTDRLGAVSDSYEPVGTLLPDAAEALGLDPEVIVAPGTGDNMAAALGLGLRTGDSVMSLGTSGAIYAVSPIATRDPSGAVAGFALDDTRFLPLVCTLNATKVTDSVARLLGTDAPGLAGLADAAGRTGAGGSAGSAPVLVPHFDGERTPNWPDAKGSVHGLTNQTSREELARAAHDGVLCGLLSGRDALADCGVPVDGVLHLIGGGARSKAYQRRCADLHGAPILIPDGDETVATGACVQAAAAHSGSGPVDLAEAWALGEGVTVEPAEATDGVEVRESYRAAVQRTAPNH